MNILKIAGIALTLSTGMASVSASASDLPCNGFQLKVINHLTDDLLVTNVTLNDAKLEPGSFGKLDKNAEKIFTVQDASKTVMTGKFAMDTLSLPTNNVKISYTLENTGVPGKDLVCSFTPTAIEGGYKVETTRLVGQVVLTISDK